MRSLFVHCVHTIVLLRSRIGNLAEETKKTTNDSGRWVEIPTTVAEEFLFLLKKSHVHTINGALTKKNKSCYKKDIENPQGVGRGEGVALWKLEDS